MRFGIDLGGTKIEIIVLAEGKAQPLFQKRVATPKGDYAATVAAIAHLIEQAATATEAPQSVGIGIPGAVSKKTGRIKNANSTWLIGEDLQADVSQAITHLYQGEVKLANDANCFALSEATDGAAAGAESVFGVIIGTGCGGGLVVNGQIINGVNSIAGEWGHNPLPWMSETDKPLPCYCGKKGCNETFLSGSGLERHFAQQTGRHLSAKSIAELAEQGDKEAEMVLNQYCVWLAKGLASVINIFDPEVIVLGGGLGNIDRLYQTVPTLWQQWIFSDAVETQLVKPKYGDASGVRGAAWL
ncbi:ROK family protein [Galenea microaerophila]